MQSGTQVEFRTLLSKEEYTRLVAKFKNISKFDVQTNHYFDTSRFSLKASETSLRVRERDNVLEFTLKRKKGYNIQEYRQTITREEFNETKETGILPVGTVKNEVESIVANQKIENFMSLSTKRICFIYGNGVIFLDENSYLDVVDYELEYEAKTLHEGKEEFIQLVKDFQIKYRKTEKKIRRAYNALKKMY